MSAKDSDRAYAHLTVTSETMEPSEMAELAGLEPDGRWTRGEESDSALRGTRWEINRRSGVEFRSRISETLDGERHLHDLIWFMRANELNLTRLTRHAQITEALVGLWSFSTFHTQSFFLDRHDLELLQRLGVSLWLDCNWPGTD